MEQGMDFEEVEDQDGMEEIDTNLEEQEERDGIDEEVKGMNSEQMVKLLNSSSQTHSSETKLKLALHIFKSKDIFVLNKEQLLLDWLTATFLKTSSSISNEATTLACLQQKYWRMFLDLLSSPSLSAFAALRANLLNIFSSVISWTTSSSSSSEDRVSLLKLVNQSYLLLFSKFSSSFRPSLEHFAIFLASIMDAVAKQEKTQFSELEEVNLGILSHSIDIFLSIERQQFNQKKVQIVCNEGMTVSDIWDSCLKIARALAVATLLCERTRTQFSPRRTFQAIPNAAFENSTAVGSMSLQGTSLARILSLILATTRTFRVGYPTKWQTSCFGKQQRRKSPEKKKN
jgi:hypothetical protein